MIMIAARHQVVHLVHGQRMDEVNAVIAAEEFFRSLADIRAEVHRINEVYIRICFAQLGNAHGRCSPSARRSSRGGAR